MRQNGGSPKSDPWTGAACIAACDADPTCEAVDYNCVFEICYFHTATTNCDLNYLAGDGTITGAINDVYHVKKVACRKLLLYLKALIIIQ